MQRASPWLQRSIHRSRGPDTTHQPNQGEIGKRPLLASTSLNRRLVALARHTLCDGSDAPSIPNVGTETYRAPKRAEYSHVETPAKRSRHLLVGAQGSNASEVWPYRKHTSVSAVESLRTIVERRRFLPWTVAMVKGRRLRGLIVSKSRELWRSQKTIRTTWKQYLITTVLRRLKWRKRRNKRKESWCNVFLK